jgi:hypothetical protein
MRRPIGTAAFWTFTLGYATTAMACGAHGPPDSFSAYPGLSFFRPDLILLYPVLSGTLERPFYSRAGYLSHTWAFSVQANLLAAIASSAVGLVMMGLLSNSQLMLSIFVIAPLVSLLVKCWWFRRVPHDGANEPGLRWFLLATILSTGVIASLPFWMGVFGTDRQSWALLVYPLKLIVSLLLFAGMIGLHVHLFRRCRRVAAIERRGFEVLFPTGPVPHAMLAPTQMR